MRPTLKQLYNDPLAIITALEEAGLENARAKVMGIMRRVCEYWSMDRYYGRLDRDRTFMLQGGYDPVKTEGEAISAKVRMRNRKRANETDRSRILASSNLKALGRRLETKMAKWPDLELDPTTLRKKPDQKLISKILKRRMRKNQSVRKFIG